MLKDHPGSTRVVVDEIGAVAAHYNYLPFGELFDSNIGDHFAYRYTGQEYDQGTGLHNFHARFYDEELGRFYATDPAGQFHSSYVGVGNNPISYIDPDGR